MHSVILWGISTMHFSEIFISILTEMPIEKTSLWKTVTKTSSMRVQWTVNRQTARKCYISGRWLFLHILELNSNADSRRWSWSRMSVNIHSKLTIALAIEKYRHTVSTLHFSYAESLNITEPQLNKGVHACTGMWPSCITKYINVVSWRTSLKGKTIYHTELST